VPYILDYQASPFELSPGVTSVFADAVTMADSRVVYKNGAKEIAHRNGGSITFMAKPDYTGRTEQRLFDEVVTSWERERVFERG